MSYLACESGCSRIVDYLIGFDLQNVFDHRFFTITCKNNHIDIAKKFLILYQKNGTRKFLRRINNNFVMACSKGYIELMMILMSTEVAELLNYEYGFIDACENSQLKIVMNLIDYVPQIIIDIGFYSSARNHDNDVYDFLISHVSHGKSFLWRFIDVELFQSLYK